MYFSALLERQFEDSHHFAVVSKQIPVEFTCLSWCEVHVSHYKLE